MKEKLKTNRVFIFLFVILVLFLAGGGTANSGEATKPRNVIILIADGCGSEQYTLTRWFKGAPLSLDGILVGGVKTYIADSVVADSAPTASAYATGFRTSDNFISIGPKETTLPNVPVPPEEMRYRPLATVLEGARLKGKAVGIVATSRVSHATPAAYMAHVPARKMENDIMEQAVHQNIDVVFGGGKRHLFPTSAGGKRTDGKDLSAVLKQKGYTLVENRQEMLSFHSGKIFGLFANSHMAPEIDRQEFAPNQPTLEEMTVKAIDLLSRRSDKNGFFLMVEASEPDWADHANDPAHLMSDLIQFDKAVTVALEYARKNGDTLVIALSDHNTGGMSIGNYGTSKSYSQMKLDRLLDPLKKMKLSSIGLWIKVGKERTPAKVKQVVKTYWDLDITDDEAKAILSISASPGASDEDSLPHEGFGEVLSAKYTYIGWTTHGHTGGDVPLFAYGPGSPRGLVDGPEIGKITADALGINLDNLNKRLFVEAARALGNDGTVVIDKPADAGAIVKIEYQGKLFELPVNQNILKSGNREETLEGVVVYIPNTGKAYLPLQAINIIKGKGK
jgi:alkaline phosphatase